MEKNNRTSKLSTIIMSMILVFIGISQCIAQNRAGTPLLITLLYATFPIYFTLATLLAKNKSQNRYKMILFIPVVLSVFFLHLMSMLAIFLSGSIYPDDVMSFTYYVFASLFLPNINFIDDLINPKTQVKRPSIQKYIKKHGITEDEYISRKCNPRQLSQFRTLLCIFSVFFAIIYSLMNGSLLFLVCVLLILFIDFTTKAEIVLKKKNFIYAACAMLICISCICLALYSNLVVTDVLDNTIAIKGKDIVDAVHSVFDFSELSFSQILNYFKNSNFKDNIKYELPELFDSIGVDIFDNDELKINSVLLFTSLLSGIMIVIVSVVWAFRAIKEILGKTSSGKGLPIFTTIITCAFSVSLAILANSWTKYFDGLLEVKTGTVFAALCAILACVIYIVIKNPICCQKIVDALSNIFNNVSHGSERVRIENLAAYKDLLDKGAITEEEYEAKKEEILRKKN